MRPASAGVPRSNRSLGSGSTFLTEVKKRDVSSAAPRRTPSVASAGNSLPPRPVSALARATQASNERAAKVWSRILREDTSVRAEVFSPPEDTSPRKAVFCAPRKEVVGSAAWAKRRRAQQLADRRSSRVRLTSICNAPRPSIESPLTFEHPKAQFKRLEADDELRMKFFAEVQKKEEDRRVVLARQGNIIQHNMRYARASTPEVVEQRRGQHAEKLRENIQQAKARCEQINMWKIERALSQLERQEKIENRRVLETEDELRRNMWSAVTVHAAVIAVLNEKLSATLGSTNSPQSGLAKNAARRRAQREQRAAKTMQQFWRMHRWQLKVRRKGEAAHIVASFMRAFGESVRIPLAVRKKLKTVRFVQRKWRERCLLKAPRRELALKQVEKAIYQYFHSADHEITRLRHSHKAFEKETMNRKGIHRLQKNEMATEHRTATDSMILAVVRRQHETSSMPAHIRAQAVDEFMTAKERAWGLACLKYGLEVRQYEKKFTSMMAERENLRHAGMKVPPLQPLPQPVRPTFQTVLTKAEVQEAISLGTQLCHEAGVYGSQDVAEADNPLRSSGSISSPLTTSPVVRKLSLTLGASKALTSTASSRRPPSGKDSSRRDSSRKDSVRNPNP